MAMLASGIALLVLLPQLLLAAFCSVVAAAVAVAAAGCQQPAAGGRQGYLHTSRSIRSCSCSFGVLGGV